MSTDFFEQQDVARRRTGWLVFFFLLAVAATVLAVYLVVAILVAAAQAEGQAGAEIESLWNPPLFLGVTLGVVSIILLGSLYRIAQFSTGGEAVALLLGGRRIDPQSRDLAERRLLNVVEEMAIASGVPVPPVYVLDAETSINAFAAGHQPGDAVIGVSRGCLEYLTRDELQGVMAHEFSHILNGDMRLDLRLAGTVFGILMLAVLGYYMLRIAGRMPQSNRKQGGGVALGLFLLGLALVLIGYIGVFFGKLIKAAVSRQREYLADSAAVQFTRFPGGIAGALKKIGGLPERSRIRDAHAEEVSHMFFSDAFEGMLLNFFATHPPLVKRIRRLDPTFDGRFPVVVPLREMGLAEADTGRVAAADQEAAQIREFLATPLDQRRRRARRLSPAQAISEAGTPKAAQLFYASSLMAAMPKALAEAAHEPYLARALICALLLSRDLAVRQTQLDALAKQAEPRLYQDIVRLAALTDQLGEEARVPLVDATYPVLRMLSPRQYAAFRQHVETLVEADDRIDLFEYMIRVMLLRNLDVHFGRTRPPIRRYSAITPLVGPLGTVLSTLAYAGHETQEDAERAFSQATAALGRGVPLLPKQDCTLTALDKALAELAQAAPKLQRIILAACVASIAADGKVAVRENELLRVVAGILGSPVPPIPLSELGATTATN